MAKLEHHTVGVLTGRTIMQFSHIINSILSYETIQFFSMDMSATFSSSHTKFIQAVPRYELSKIGLISSYFSSYLSFLHFAQMKMHYPIALKWYT